MLFTSAPARNQGLCLTHSAIYFLQPQLLQWKRKVSSLGVRVLLAVAVASTLLPKDFMGAGVQENSE